MILVPTGMTRLPIILSPLRISAFAARVVVASKARAGKASANKEMATKKIPHGNRIIALNYIQIKHVCEANNVWCYGEEVDVGG